MADPGFPRTGRGVTCRVAPFFSKLHENEKLGHGGHPLDKPMEGVQNLGSLVTSLLHGHLEWWNQDFSDLGEGQPLGWQTFFQQECIPVGCVPSAAVAMSIPACTGKGGWGVCVYPSRHWAGGCLPRGCLPRAVCLGGCLPGGVSQHALRQTSPCEQND